MSTHRETFFHCSYEAEGRRETAVVPAWDIEMAEALFRYLLAAEQPESIAAGVIEISSPRGEVARRARFAPAASVHAGS